MLLASECIEALEEVAQMDGAQHEFVPFAVESFGHLGEDALAFLSTLGDTVAQGGRVSKAAFVKSAFQEISCTLQRGNG